MVPAASDDGLAPADIPTVAPERAFAERVAPEPARPLPAQRRAIFFDIENTSRVEHIARVIDHLAVARGDHRTEFIAVGNWKVIGHDTARLLARHGAQLVHSAPSVGVRDWSDLRIAVTAGVWLAAARPGDVVEIVSDDRAFDAVGDVAAGLGIGFRRLSFRRLAGLPAVAALAQEPAAEAPPSRRRRGRRRGRRDGGPRPAIQPHAPAHAPAHRAGGDGAEAPAPHTAPHDEIVAVVRDLIQRSPDRAVTLDTLANALKARGFSRPPGSPRLITRLRRIRELAVSRSGTITLVGGEPAGRATSPAGVGAEEERRATDEDVSAADAPEPGNEAVPPEMGARPGEAPRRRRRSRRGGRNRRRRAAGPPPAA